MMPLWSNCTCLKTSLLDPQRVAECPNFFDCIGKNIKPFKAFRFAAVSMILKTDQSTFDSFFAYSQIAVHTKCSSSHNF
jgi:hypothetical protein